MRVAIAGWSGLVGSHLLKGLTDDSQLEQIHALGRRDGEFQAEKLSYHQVDFSDLKLQVEPLHVAYCCLGTTMKKAGSKAKFEEVDLHFVVNFAKWAKANGASKFHVISAIGVSTKSMFFYNRVKAQMELELKKLDFDCLVIYHPSILIGDRKEFRLGERFGEIIMKLFEPLMIGSFKKFRATRAETLAQIMRARIGQTQSETLEAVQLQSL